MPLPIMVAHRLVERLSRVRRAGTLRTCDPTARVR